MSCGDRRHAASWEKPDVHAVVRLLLALPEAGAGAEDVELAAISAGAILLVADVRVNSGRGAGGRLRGTGSLLRSINLHSMLLCLLSDVNQ